MSVVRDWRQEGVQPCLRRQRQSGVPRHTRSAVTATRCCLLLCCRWGKKAGTLQGHKLDHITVGSRTSCYVPALQKLVGR